VCGMYRTAVLETGLAKPKRIFEIAKDLGVDSKAIVAKCHAEGIDQNVVKNHMSSISAGLEQTIREWFSVHADTGNTATAIETSEKVDLDQVRVKGARRRKSKSEHEDDHGDSVHTDTAVAEPPALPVETPPAPPVVHQAAPPAPPARVVPVAPVAPE
jgi:translation initiation factor IF-2